MKVKIVSTSKNALSIYTTVLAQIIKQNEGYAEVVRIVEVPIANYETMSELEQSSYILQIIGVDNDANQ